MYSDFAVARTRQILGDLIALAVVIVGIVLAVIVHGAVLTLAVIGTKVEDAGNSFTTTMSNAAKAISGIPLVGKQVRTPFDGASSAGRTLSQAGQTEQASVAVLATVLALLVVAIPLYFVIRYWLVRRVRFAYRATRLSKVAQTPGGFDLLAFRALAASNERSILALSPSVVNLWRSGDPAAIQQLAALHLRESGVRLSDSGARVG